ncbi:MAG: hypothetical protein WC755_05425 [Candidatus Woesearchaeota archaeon]
MVKEKLNYLKSLHNEKVSLIKKHHNKVTNSTLKDHESDLKRVEKIVNEQLEIIKHLEESYSFEDEYSEKFDNFFHDSIKNVRQKMNDELDVMRKVTNPFYDGQVRVSKFNDFAKNYELELMQKKNLFDRVLDKVAVLKIGKGKKDSDVDEDVSEGEKVVTTETTEITKNKEGVPSTKITEETLITNLKNAEQIKEEFDVQMAVDENAIKLKLELKIVYTPDNEAWAFIYQKYYHVDEKEPVSFKSGQIKGYNGKLTKLRQEYLDKIYHDLDDKVMSKETVKDIRKAIAESLEKDQIIVY